MQENFSLKAYNTFGVEAKAKYFVEVTTIEELKEAITFSNSQTTKNSRPVSWRRKQYFIYQRL
jgi:UDP-N-acetylmuramate dehydrogenase